MHICYIKLVIQIEIRNELAIKGIIAYVVFLLCISLLYVAHIRSCIITAFMSDL